MNEEEKSKQQATKADNDHADLVKAQKDSYCTVIIVKRIQNGNADAE